MNRKDFSVKTSALLLVAVLAVAAGLRLWQLDRAALWEDDYFNLNRGLMPLAAMFHAQMYSGPTETFHDYQPPLQYALVHAALAVSRTSLAARLVSFAAVMLSIVGLFRLGAGLFGARAGLFAALLAALSLFSIDAARSIKTYGVYFCASVWALHFLYQSVCRGRSRLWWAFVPCAAAMVYSSFLGIPSLAAQIAFAGAVLTGDAIARAPGWQGRVRHFAWACLGVAALCLPWVPAVVFIREMFYNPGADPMARMSLAKVLEFAGGFVSHVFETPAWGWAGLPLLALAGCVAALAGRRFRELALLALWAGLPAATLLTSRSEMSEALSTRHFYNMFGFLVLAAGLGADALPRLLPGRLERAAGLALGCLLCVWASAPGLSRLPEYYARSISYDRDVAYWLYTRVGAADSLDVQGWKRATKRFAMNWYLPGVFTSSGDRAAPGYRRVLTLENSLDSRIAGFPEPDLWREGFTLGPFGTQLSLRGELGRSPLAVTPDSQGRFRYADDFSGLALRRDAHSLRNASTDRRLGVLLPSDWSRPGEAVYRFVLPEGARVRSITAKVTGVLYKRHPSSRTEARIDLAAGASPESLREAGAISLDDFLAKNATLSRQPCEPLEEIPIYGACAREAKTWDLTGLAGGGREFCVRISITPGKEEGYLFVDDFQLDVRCEPGNAPRTDPLALELETLMANGRVRPWRPGAASLDGLYAFAPGEGALAGLSTPGSSLGTPGDLERFRREHPGLVPVYRLQDSSGAVAAVFYDPPLSFSDALPGRDVSNRTAFTARGVVLAGRLNAPELNVAGSRLAIPVACPRGSVLMLNPGGEGRLIWSPDFSKGAYSDLDFDSQDNLRPSPDADNDGGLTCREERPCSFTARFVSALPVSRVRLEWYPRVVGSPDGKNVVRLSYSTDEGRTFTPLEEFTGRGLPSWSPMFAKHATVLDFSKPVNHFMLKAELSGEDAQLWSHARAADRMWLEASLDARSVGTVELPAADFPLGLTGPPGNDFRVHFMDRPVPMLDAIKDWR